MASNPPEEDLDDAISLTSTDDGIPDDDLFVTKILAEGVVNGDPVCLIKWQDYPLAEASWEPRKNLGDALMAEWEKIKADQRKGLVPKFNIQEWETANIQHYESRLARHRLRNIAREKLGLPQTEWTKTLDHLLRDLAAVEYDEDGEDDQAKADSTAQSLPQSDETSAPVNHPMDRLSEPLALLTIKPSERVSPESFTRTSDDGGGHVEAERALSSVKTPVLTPSSNERPASEDANATTQKLDQGHIKPSRSSCRLPRRSSIFNRAQIGGSAKPAGYANVFAGGRTRKGRGTLSDAASNPERDPRLLNLHLIRKLELQRRDKEGLKPPPRRPSALISLDHHNLQSTTGGQETVEEAADIASASKKSHTESTSPKKSAIVQWEDEAMEIDPTDSLFVSDDLPLTSHIASDPEGEEPGADTEHSSDPTTISKTVQVGPDRQNTVTLSFEGVPPKTSAPWAMQFSSDDRLIFTHTCTTQDFEINKGGDLSAAQLCKGTALSFTENICLSNLADNLRLADLGILCSNESYYVILFPSKQSAQDSGKMTLEYTIFEPLSSLGSSMLAPAPRLRMLSKDIISSPLYPRPLDRVFGEEFEQLIPSDARKAKKYNFFLAFPLRAEREAFMFSWWVRSYHSDSDIRTSFQPGHWSSFSKLPHGTVIIHEDSLWFIRLFPKLNALLHGRRASFSFWMFGRSLAPVRSFGSDNLPVPPPGDIRLQRVFDPGAAYLITPSFLISEPEQAYTFLKWFWNIHVKKIDMSRPSKLVLCAKVDEWMRNLIEEKSLARRNLLDTASEEELQAAGLSDKAVECRNKSFKLLQQLVYDADYEKTNFIVVAPDSIDGNDEQSLVNWYGYWSTLNIDQFRRYAVIGSGSQSKRRLSRILRAPSYSSSIIADPDGIESNLAKSPDSVSTMSPSTERSNRDAESSKLSLELSDLAKKQRTVWCPVKLYWSPVGYSTSDISFRLGDIDPKYRNCDEWFNFFWNHYKTSYQARLSRNSYAGLFYTLDEDKALSRGVHNVKRSPWVVIFRPTNPHLRQWEQSEIFIWDTRYSEMIGERKNLCYSDLSEFQQKLIEYIQAKTKDDIPLEKVWVGSFGAGAGSHSPLNVTVRWLDGLLDNVRDWLPAPAKELPLRGWSLVTPERPPENQESDSVAKDDDIRKLLSLQNDTSSSTPKIIFHPPSGNNQKLYSKSRNRLYQCAREADPKFEGKCFEYVFRPTMDWYEEQCEEGRGFEHIKVVPWQDIFQMYKIKHFLHKKG